MALKRWPMVCRIAALFGVLLFGLANALQAAQAAIPDPPQVESSYKLTCLVSADGRLNCFGQPLAVPNNPPAPPAGVRYTQVSMGSQEAACALRSDGNIACWGDTLHGMLSVPALPAGLTYTSVGVGYFSVCAVRSDGSVVCWGNMMWNQLNVPALPAGVTYTDVSGGSELNCGLRSNGTIICWGIANYGGLNVPALPEGVTYTQLSVGNFAACALRSDHALACWGRALYNELNVPALPAETYYTYIAVGASAACALRSDNVALCWGDHAPPGSPPYTPPGITYETISVTDYDACVRYSDDTAACWGANAMGQDPILSLGPTSLPDFTVGQFYDHALTTLGGTAPYTYTLYSGTLPPGASLASDGRLSGMVTGGGDFNFVIQVKDSHIVPFSAWRAYSSHQPSAPASADASLTVPEDTQAAFSVDSFPFSDANTADTLQAVQIESLPALGALYLDANYSGQPDAGEAASVGLVIASADLPALKFKPEPDANRTDGAAYASFTFKVSDGGLYSQDAYTLAIYVPPVNDAPGFTPGGDVTVLEDAGPQSLPAWATNLSPGPADESGQSLSFVTSANDNPDLFDARPAAAADGTLNFIPAPNANGSALISLRLSDDGGTANGGVDHVTQAFAITVTAVNDAPSFTPGGDVTALEDAGPQDLAWATNLSPGPANESGQSLSFSLTGNTNPALFSAGPLVSPQGRLRFTPAADANGSATLSLRLSDDGGTANGGVDLSPVHTFTITLTPVNDAPSFTPGGDVTALEDAGPQDLAWATNLSPGPANESGQSLSFSLTGNTNPALFSAGPVVSPQGRLRFTPAADANGSAVLSLRLSDDGGTASGGVDHVTQTFAITVTAVNDAPGFTKGDDVTVLEDAGPQTFPAWASHISPGAGNEAGQSLAFTVTANTNPGLFSVGPQVDAQGVLRFTPASDANGVAVMRLGLQDSGGTANGGIDLSPLQTFTITLTPVNDAPGLSLLGDGRVTAPAASGAFQAVWATALSPGPADESGQSLSFELSNDSPGLFSLAPSLTIDGTVCTLRFSPALGAVGVAHLTARLKDSAGGETSYPFTIAILPRQVFLPLVRR